MRIKVTFNGENAQQKTARFRAAFGGCVPRPHIRNGGCKYQLQAPFVNCYYTRVCFKKIDTHGEGDGAVSVVVAVVLLLIGAVFGAVVVAVFLLDNDP